MCCRALFGVVAPNQLVAGLFWKLCDVACMLQLYCSNACQCPLIVIEHVCVVAGLPCPCSLPAGYDVTQTDLAGESLTSLFSSSVHALHGPCHMPSHVLPCSHSHSCETGGSSECCSVLRCVTSESGTFKTVACCSDVLGSCGVAAVELLLSM